MALWLGIRRRTFSSMVSSPKGRPLPATSSRIFSALSPLLLSRRTIWTYALGLDMPDFEDAMQAAAAVACRADYIVTRNTEHYRKSPVKALAPDAWLRKYGRAPT